MSWIVTGRVRSTSPAPLRWRLLWGWLPWLVRRPGGRPLPKPVWRWREDGHGAAVLYLQPASMEAAARVAMRDLRILWLQPIERPIYGQECRYEAGKAGGNEGDFTPESR